MLLFVEHNVDYTNHSRESLDGVKASMTVATHHKIKARELLRDIRASLSDEELMDKFEISKQGLQTAFDQLIKAGFLTQKELRTRSGLAAPTGVHDSARTLPRFYLVVRVEIQDREDPANKGIIKDINEKGIGIVGIQAALDEVKDLVIPASDFTLEDDISFQAKCRWTKMTAQGKYVCGFQIVAIEDENLERLRQLIHELSIEPPV
jgi:hypothetical protein